MRQRNREAEDAMADKSIWNPDPNEREISATGDRSQGVSSTSVALPVWGHGACRGAPAVPAAGHGSRAVAEHDARDERAERSRLLEAGDRRSARRSDDGRAFREM